MTQPFPFENPLIRPKLLSYVVRFNDCDPMGHLNNSKFIDYFINAMEDYLAVHYKIILSKELSKGIGWVVRDHNVLFIRPAKHHQQIKIEVLFIRLLEKEFQVEFRMYDQSGENIISMMRSNFACLEVKTGRRSAHPENVFFALNNAINLELAGCSSVHESYQEMRRTARKKVGKPKKATPVFPTKKMNSTSH